MASEFTQTKLGGRQGLVYTPILVNWCFCTIEGSFKKPCRRRREANSKRA